ncbi:MAG TPA: hypothetical protein VJV79_22420 [Polyangiaceae bacterium]|nr:hypothetical protein [Polyangiaceae bacterium]
MQTPSSEALNPEPSPRASRQPRLTARARVAIGLFALLVVGGVGTASAIAALGPSDGSVEGY